MASGERTDSGRGRPSSGGSEGRTLKVVLRGRGHASTVRIGTDFLTSRSDG